MFLFRGGLEEEGDAASPEAKAAAAKRRHSTALQARRRERLSSQSPWRERLWAFVDDPSSSTMAYWFSITIMTLIFLSTATFVIETIDAVRDSGTGSSILFVVETICIVFFTLEVILRIISVGTFKQYASDPFNYVDVLAIAPYYIELAVPHASGASSLGVLRVIRLVRVARVMKVSRYSNSIRIFTAAMGASVRPLSMLVFLVSIAMVVFSSGVYYAELTDDGCRRNGWEDVGRATADHGQLYCLSDGGGWRQLDDDGRFTYQPPDGSSPIDVHCACTDPNPFTSIPATFWWALVTMTTVGYGDNIPVTAIGKLVAAVTMLSGVIILALPITVIGTNFSRVLREIQQERMLAELEELDDNEDGQVDEHELATMIAQMTAVAGAAAPATDAKALLEQYDRSKTGQLNQAEAAQLREDLRAALSRTDSDRAFSLPTASSSKTSNRLPGGASDPSRPGGSVAGSGEEEEEEEEEEEAGSDQESPGGDTLAVLRAMRPAAAVARHLQALEQRIDRKLTTVVELLRKMNAAVSNADVGERLL